jgi:hypothetical protein
MFDFFKTLKKDKWYIIDDSFHVKFEEDGLIKVRYAGVSLTVDIPSAIASDYFVRYILPTIGKSLGIDGGKDIEDLSVDELNMLLEQLLENEDYEGCQKIKKIIDEKEKGDKES